MKWIVAAVLLVLAVGRTVGVAGGADSPVIVWHEVIGLDTGPNKMIVRYLLHVVNGTDRPLSGLTLAVVPPAPEELKELFSPVHARRGAEKHRTGREARSIGQS